MSPGPLIRVEGQPVSIKCDVDEYGGPREQVRLDSNSFNMDIFFKKCSFNKKQTVGRCSFNRSGCDSRFLNFSCTVIPEFPPIIELFNCPVDMSMLCFSILF